MILLIDNYDSFSHNLYQLIGAELAKQRKNAAIKIIRNDELSVGEVEKLNPELIIVSPGPGAPKDAGICIEVIQKLAAKIPIFGVCLGHQSIAEAFGGVVSHAKELKHGKASMVALDANCLLFKGIKSPTQVARYHSLAITKMPACLTATATADDGEIMALKHKSYDTYGVQFHPESILTPHGDAMVANLLEEFIKADGD